MATCWRKDTETTLRTLLYPPMYIFSKRAKKQGFLVHILYIAIHDQAGQLSQSDCCLFSSYSILQNVKYLLIEYLNRYIVPVLQQQCSINYITKVAHTVKPKEILCKSTGDYTNLAVSASYVWRSSQQLQRDAENQRALPTISCRIWYITKCVTVYH